MQFWTNLGRIPYINESSKWILYPASMNMSMGYCCCLHALYTVCCVYISQQWAFIEPQLLAAWSLGVLNIYVVLYECALAASLCTRPTNVIVMTAHDDDDDVWMRPRNFILARVCHVDDLLLYEFDGIMCSNSKNFQYYALSQIGICGYIPVRPGLHQP